MNTHGLKINFGKHAGTLYTRVPVQYLKWMVQCSHSKADIAKAELERRGTVTPNVEISGHAIDSASLRLRWLWHETSKKNEGLHAWLVRFCEDALKNHKMDEENCIYLDEVKLVFEPGEWPILKTCMPRRRKK